MQDWPQVLGSKAGLVGPTIGKLITGVVVSASDSKTSKNPSLDVREPLSFLLHILPPFSGTRSAKHVSNASFTARPINVSASRLPINLV